MNNRLGVIVYFVLMVTLAIVAGFLLWPALSAGALLVVIPVWWVFVEQLIIAAPASWASGWPRFKAVRR